ncbi:MAG: hypothetical protein Q4G43_12230 [Mobilicoccus sp.]|nr:hypothetical protein [Mobilicoccus sp.]
MSTRLPHRPRRLTATLTGALAVSLTSVAMPSLAVAAPLADPATAVDLDAPVQMRTFPITRGGETLYLGYCGNAPLESALPGVTDVVVVVHGDGRGACSYATSVQRAARAAGRVTSTLVVAPHFAANGDPEGEEPSRLTWGTSGWKDGANSRVTPYPRPWRISSFEAVDVLVDHLTRGDLLPDLTTLTVAGHSAGGQFVNRYLATTQRPAASTPRVERRWIVASPSSYLYLDERRINRGGRPGSLSGRERRDCPDYNTYKYGLAGRTGYAAAMTDDQIRARVASTPVSYLVGSLDDDPANSSLDTSCAGLMQGPDRVRRALNYQTHLASVLPRGSASHRLRIVPGVGHTARGVFTSPEGVAALFPTR